MDCQICHEEMGIAQDEPFGRLYVCTKGHWWHQDFKTFLVDRVPEGEKNAA